MTRASSIWHYPTGGKAPDIGGAIHAPDLATLSRDAVDVQNRAITAIKERTSINIDMLRQIQRDLGAKGISFDLDTLTGAFENETPVDTNLPDDLPFALIIPLALTHAPEDIPLEDHDIRAEIARLRGNLASQVNTERGPALRPVLPGNHLDAIDPDEEGLLATLSEITHYWPPATTGPALALIERQEDGAMPIEILLAAHGTPAHQRLAALLSRLEGSLG